MVYIKTDKKDIEKAIKHQQYYYANQQKLIDAHKTRTELASLRRRSFLKLQKRKKLSTKLSICKKKKQESYLIFAYMLLQQWQTKVWQKKNS